MGYYIDIVFEPGRAIGYEEVVDLFCKAGGAGMGYFRAGSGFSPAAGREYRSPCNSKVIVPTSSRHEVRGQIRCLKSWQRFSC